jgi:type II secretory pathway pseudopilin PulG
MRFSHTHRWPLVVKRGRRNLAFTLAEVLAALAFMAIVIPVAVEGLRVASRAGQVGVRKAVAARVAERVLNEASVTGQLNGNSQRGMIQEGVQQFNWSIRSEPWSEGAMRLVTVLVTFPLQGQEYDVRVSTLMDNSSQ